MRKIHVHDAARRKTHIATYRMKSGAARLTPLVSDLRDPTPTHAGSSNKCAGLRINMTTLGTCPFVLLLVLKQRLSNTADDCCSAATASGCNKNP